MYPTLHYAAECVTVPVTASSMYVNVCYCQQHVLLCLLLPPRCVTVPVTVNSMCVLYLLLIKACMLLCLLMLAAPIASYLYKWGEHFGPSANFKGVAKINSNCSYFFRSFQSVDSTSPDPTANKG